MSPDLEKLALSIVEELDATPADARKLLMESRCEGNPTLRRAVETFWKAHQEIADGSFLQQPVVAGLTPEAIAPTIHGRDGAQDSQATFISNAATADTAPDTADGDRLGSTRFIPKERLGVGGQGEVWLAYDPEIGRYVAVKIIKPGLRGSRPTIAKLQREAEVTGKLEHPNIVPVYDAGKESSDDGAPFYVMRVFGNRYVLRAVAALHDRPRTPEVEKLHSAIRAYADTPNEGTLALLNQAEKGFSFDINRDEDIELQRSLAALCDSESSPSGRSLKHAIIAFHKGNGPKPVCETCCNI